MPKLNLAVTPAQRARGLLFRKPDESVLLIAPCHDIHTFGMHYAIDIAFVDRSGLVLDSCTDVLPGKRKRCPGAYATLERFSNQRTPWVVQGDQLEINGF